MNEIRVGVIGLGSIGLRMLAAFEEHPDFVGIIAWDPSSGSTDWKFLFWSDREKEYSGS